MLFFRDKFGTSTVTEARNSTRVLLMQYKILSGYYYMVAMRCMAKWIDSYVVNVVGVLLCESLVLASQWKLQSTTEFSPEKLSIQSGSKSFERDKYKRTDFFSSLIRSETFSDTTQCISVNTLACWSLPFPTRRSRVASLHTYIFVYYKTCHAASHHKT